MYRLKYIFLCWHIWIIFMPATSFFITIREKGFACDHLFELKIYHKNIWTNSRSYMIFLQKNINYLSIYIIAKFFGELFLNIGVGFTFHFEISREIKHFGWEKWYVCNKWYIIVLFKSENIRLINNDEINEILELNIDQNFHW